MKGPGQKHIEIQGKGEGGADLHEQGQGLGVGGNACTSDHPLDSMGFLKILIWNRRSWS